MTSLDRDCYSQLEPGHGGPGARNRLPPAADRLNPKVDYSRSKPQPLSAPPPFYPIHATYKRGPAGPRPVVGHDGPGASNRLPPAADRLNPKVDYFRSKPEPLSAPPPFSPIHATYKRGAATRPHPVVGTSLLSHILLTHVQVANSLTHSTSNHLSHDPLLFNFRPRDRGRPLWGRPSTSSKFI